MSNDIVNLTTEGSPTSEDTILHFDPGGTSIYVALAMHQGLDTIWLGEEQLEQLRVELNERKKV